MNREAQSIVVTLLGGALLRISLSDLFMRYVKEAMQPFLIASAIVLLVIGLYPVVSELLWPRRAAAAQPDAGELSAAGAGAETLVVTGSDGHDGHGHGHEHGGPRIAWLLLLPVLAIFLVAPPALGSYAASRGSVAVPESTDSNLGALPEGEVALSLVDYANRAVWDDGRTLQGRTVELTGFVTPATDGKSWFVTRMMMSCCAADASAVLVEVQGVPAPDKDTWVSVRGTYTTYPGAKEAGAAVIAASSVEQVRQPADPYEG
ncbi:TIGR03943 family putative permease subunit [Motilibacter aurantiacus]|uniref:TIGR03943 family putative permease subunit n=1 Tax=Motilibacter aurantiacus TaxID=2714955 RepID=UPI002F2B7B19